MSSVALSRDGRGAPPRGRELPARWRVCGTTSRSCVTDVSSWSSASAAEVGEVLRAGRAVISPSLVALIQNQSSHPDALLAGIFSGRGELRCREVWAPSTTTRNNPVIKLNTLAAQNKHIPTCSYEEQTKSCKNTAVLRLRTGGRKRDDPGRNPILRPLICVCLGGRVHPRTPTLWGPRGPLKHNPPTSPRTLRAKHTIVFFSDLAVRFTILARIFASCKLGLLVLLEKCFHRFRGGKKKEEKAKVLPGFDFAVLGFCQSRLPPRNTSRGRLVLANRWASKNVRPSASALAE